MTEHFEIAYGLSLWLENHRLDRPCAKAWIVKARGRGEIGRIAWDANLRTYVFRPTPSPYPIHRFRPEWCTALGDFMGQKNVDWRTRND